MSLAPTLHGLRIWIAEPLTFEIVHRRRWVFTGERITIGDQRRYVMQPVDTRETVTRWPTGISDTECLVDRPRGVLHCNRVFLEKLKAHCALPLGR